jgi:hypothetical protein
MGFANHATESGPLDRTMIDSTHCKVHRAAASLLDRGISSRRIVRTKGGLNSKLHAVWDGAGRPVIFRLTEDQAAQMYPMLPEAETLMHTRVPLP